METVKRLVIYLVVYILLEYVLIRYGLYARGWFWEGWHTISTWIVLSAVSVYFAFAFKGLQAYKKGIFIAGLFALNFVLLNYPPMLLLEHDLKNNGVCTECIVTAAFTTRPMRYKEEETKNNKCRFVVNNKVYESKVEEGGLCKIGDTLHVIYSSKHPENCDIVELR